MVKEWSAKLQNHITHWTQNLPHGYRHWPRYIYHFTDIHNAANILRYETIFSRNKSTELGLMENENANANVIQNTCATHKNFVRLYHAPLTPTQYNNEGIKPQDKHHEPHCPIPIFFAFDSMSVMSLDNTSFSNGNMATATVSYGPNEVDFDKIPFDKVFHRGYLPQDPTEKASIIFHRHAEVLVPNELSFSSGLQWIGCRSLPEFNTLCSLIGPEIYNKLKHLIYITDSSFYYKSWMFVESATLNNNTLSIQLNPNAQFQNNINCNVVITPSNLEAVLIQKQVHSREVINILIPENYDSFLVQLYLDDTLALQTTFSNSTLV
ncbi:DUF4433 domain-containing protein [Desulfovibrio mangrovi]|uniref:DarT ssDNA thymidine ADP-ribosyltransferase family protein n=1 Tax=Desulfovibrio mangrovi TaxID=2976983 RepID=UPI002247B34E|nr:DarT ssDNA thymidine ADP-ribosyltransferase family protein [Desulfovibrio mangrovi]UZP67675.1 DUF4433 domain-containing protein [Desulfovibrio mangrovi]